MMAMNLDRRHSPHNQITPVNIMPVTRDDKRRLPQEAHHGCTSPHVNANSLGLQKTMKSPLSC